MSRKKRHPSADKTASGSQLRQKYPSAALKSPLQGQSRPPVIRVSLILCHAFASGGWESGRQTVSPFRPEAFSVRFLPRCAQFAPGSAGAFLLRAEEPAAGAASAPPVRAVGARRLRPAGGFGAGNPGKSLFWRLRLPAERSCGHIVLTLKKKRGFFIIKTTEIPVFCIEYFPVWI